MGLIIYNLFLLLYRTGVFLLSPWNPKASKWRKGRQNIFETIRASIDPQNMRPTIWMHCASLGEFEQGRPVLEHLRATHPDTRIVLTFFSASGYEIRKNYQGADHIYYLPMDSRKHAENFISLVRPSLVLWVKYEYWYYYLEALHKRRIPVLLVSGIFRDDQVFFQWYGSLHRHMLQFFSQFFVQNEASRELLAGIGFKDNVLVSGDTRFDRVIEIARQFTPINAIQAFCGDKQVIVAGSTWAEDEEELDHFANTNPNTRFIIAPHEIDPEHLKDVRALFHHSLLFSEWQQRLQSAGHSKLATEPNVLIIDNIGMLSRLYKYASIAYIGGGFGEEGVHNVLEAAVYGVPIVFGPVYEKFIEAADLVDCGAAFSIENALELEEVFTVLLKSRHEQVKAGEAASSYVYRKKGAEEKIVEYIERHKLLKSLGT